MTPFEVLADATRLEIAILLQQHDKLSVGALSKLLPTTPSQPNLSKHLRVMRDANLVESTSSGREQLYTLRTEGWLRTYLWAAVRRYHYEREYA
jgi:DNA-binding transcriptional ArsR family regulator